MQRVALGHSFMYHSFKLERGDETVLQCVSYLVPCALAAELNYFQISLGQDTVSAVPCAFRVFYSAEYRVPKGTEDIYPRR